MNELHIPESRPTRARGLKFLLHGIELDVSGVAPHAGAWIEMPASRPPRRMAYVAPHAGAWIEIILRHKFRYYKRVAPHAGAWIEMLMVSS